MPDGFGKSRQARHSGVVEAPHPEGHGSLSTDRHFTGVRVNSLMVNPLTGSLREKRRTFRPLTSETSTGLILPHMPTCGLKYLALSLGVVRPDAYTHSTCGLPSMA